MVSNNGSSSPPWFSSPTQSASPATVLTMMNEAMRPAVTTATATAAATTAAAAAAATTAATAATTTAADPKQQQQHHHHHHELPPHPRRQRQMSSEKKVLGATKTGPSSLAVERLRGQARFLLHKIDDSDLFRNRAPHARSRRRSATATATAGGGGGGGGGGGSDDASAASSSSSTSFVPPPTSSESYLAGVPTFDCAEVVVGPILGKGGFCSVYQVDSIRLLRVETTKASVHDGSSPPSKTARIALGVATSDDPHHHPHRGEHDDDNDDHIPNVHDDDDDDVRFWSGTARLKRGGARGGASVASTLSSCSSAASSWHDDGFTGGSGSGSPLPGVLVEGSKLMRADRSRPIPPPPRHVNIVDPRHFMHQRARRTQPRQHGDKNATHEGGNNETKKSEARYAIKKLHWETLSEFERVRGSIDLAMEAKYLSALHHPNIVKMRAVASGDVLDKNFFIIMDRLYGTLADKIKSWKQAQRDCRSGWFGLFPDHDRMEHILIERLIVAYDVSSALAYMHKNRLVYRDIKKENIGFDVRGDTKIFDFGLSKCLSADLKARDPVTGAEVYGYRLTPRTGSICTMAPEVASGLPYDEKCDVFSFAILLWEILALESPFPSYTRKEYMFRVVEMEERPWIHVRWPSVTKKLLRHAWESDPEQRPDMKRASVMLRADLTALTDAPEVKDRTIHMLNRSTHSFCMEPREVSEERETDHGRAWHGNDHCGESSINL